MAVGDLDLDGDLDLAVANGSQSASGSSNNVSVLLHEDGDCNGNGVPDECDFTTGTSLDGNADNIPDACEIITGIRLYCNANGIPDECDDHLAGNWNDDGIIDLADLSFLIDCLAGPGEGPRAAACANLYVSVFDQNHDGDVDLRDVGAIELLVTP